MSYVGGKEDDQKKVDVMKGKMFVKIQKLVHNQQRAWVKLEMWSLLEHPGPFPIMCTGAPKTLQVARLFHPQSGYPGFRQTEETMVMIGLIALVLRLIAKGNPRGSCQVHLTLQYTENPHNICASLTWLQVPYCNLKCICNDSSQML